MEVVGNIRREEAEHYVNDQRALHGRGLKRMRIKENGSFVDIDTYTRRPFERIRRITGYLVGTTDRWNDGKCAEERDRVKHVVEE